MKEQSKDAWCGIASIANALEVLGIRRSQKEIARVCHVTKKTGTNEVEMKRALMANGMSIDEFSSKDGKEAVSWLKDALLNRGPVILCVDNDDHWVTAVGFCKESFILFDPSINCGIEVHEETTLLERWVNEDLIYYGLGCSK